MKLDSSHTQPTRSSFLYHKVLTLAALRGQLPRLSAISHSLMSSICFTPLSSVLFTQDILLLTESVYRHRHLFNDNAAEHGATETLPRCGWTEWAEGSRSQGCGLVGRAGSPTGWGELSWRIGAPGGLVTLWPIFQSSLFPSGKQTASHYFASVGQTAETKTSLFHFPS